MSRHRHKPKRNVSSRQNHNSKATTKARDDVHNFEPFDYARKFQLNSKLAEIGGTQNVSKETPKDPNDSNSNNNNNNNNNVGYSEIQEFCNSMPDDEKLCIPIEVLQKQMNEISCEDCRFLTNRRGLEMALKDGTYSLTYLENEISNCDFNELAEDHNNLEKENENSSEKKQDCPNDLDVDIESGVLSQSKKLYQLSLIRVADGSSSSSPSLQSDSFCSLGNTKQYWMTPQFIERSIRHLNWICDNNGTNPLNWAQLSRCYRGFTRNILPTFSFVNMIRALSDECRNVQRQVQERREEWFYKMKQKASPWTKTMRDNSGKEFDPSISHYFLFDKIMKEWFSTHIQVVLVILKYHHILQIPHKNHSNNKTGGVILEFLAPMLLSMSSTDNADFTEDFGNGDEYHLTEENMLDLWKMLERSFRSLHDANMKYKEEQLENENDIQLCFSAKLRHAYAEILRKKYENLKQLHVIVIEYSEAITGRRQVNVAKAEKDFIDEYDPQLFGYSPLHDIDSNLSASTLNMKHCDKILWDTIDSYPYDNSIIVEKVETELTQTLMDIVFDTPRDKKSPGKMATVATECGLGVLSNLDQVWNMLKAHTTVMHEEFEKDKSRINSTYFTSALIRLQSVCDDIKPYTKIDGSDPCSMLSLLTFYHQILQFLVTLKTLVNIKSSYKKKRFCSGHNNKDIKRRFEALVTLNVCYWFEERYSIWRANKAEQELLEELLASETSTLAENNHHVTNKRLKKKKKRNKHNESKVKYFESCTMSLPEATKSSLHETPDLSITDSDADSSCNTEKKTYSNALNRSFCEDDKEDIFEQCAIDTSSINEDDCCIENFPGESVNSKSDETESQSSIKNNECDLISTMLNHMSCNPQDLQSSISTCPDYVFPETKPASTESYDNSDVIFYFGQFEKEYSSATKSIDIDKGKLGIRFPTGDNIVLNHDEGVTIQSCHTISISEVEEKPHLECIPETRENIRYPMEHTTHYMGRDETFVENEKSTSYNFNSTVAYSFLVKRFSDIFEREFDVSTTGQLVPIVRF